MRRTNNKTRSDTRLVSRVINEKRWIHCNQLKVGMFVSELDRPWSETQFMFQGFRIDSPSMLAAVQDSCEYACVETEKLAQVPSNSKTRLCGAFRSQ